VCTIPHQLEVAVEGKLHKKVPGTVGPSVGALVVGDAGANVGAPVAGAGVGSADACDGGIVDPGKIRIVSIEMSPVYDVPRTPTNWIDVVLAGT
jgi:hypothetical protein